MIGGAISLAILSLLAVEWIVLVDEKEEFETFRSISKMRLILGTGASTAIVGAISGIVGGAMGGVVGGVVGGVTGEVAGGVIGGAIVGAVFFGLWVRLADSIL